MFLNGEWELETGAAALGDKVDFIDNCPTTDPGHENDGLHQMPGASELGGFAVSAKTKNPAEAVKVVAALVEYVAKAGYVVKAAEQIALSLQMA